MSEPAERMATLSVNGPELSRTVSQFVSGTKGLLISGGITPAASGKTFEVFDPSSGRLITRCAEGDREDIDRAVRSAHEAFERGPWSRFTPAARCRTLWKVGELVLKYGDELAELEALDNGKSVSIARAVDVRLTAEMFQYMSGWATRLEGSVLPLSFDMAPNTAYHAFTRRQPVGVVGQIIPWNFPLLMAAWKLAPALVTGNTVVLKPAEQTPLTALRLGEILLEAGVPPGVVNVVTGFGETAGAALAAHLLVRKVAFTGSTEVGKLIVKAAAADLKRVSLELGGKSPNIILADADLDQAIAGAANAIFFNHGQSCVAGSRLFIQEAIFDKVVSGVAELAQKIKLGPGLNPDTEMGPMVSGDQFERVTGYLKSGLDQGASAACGGGRWGDRGYFVEPTVLVDVRRDMKVYQEEIFGPVVAALPFKEVDDNLIAQANESRYGLAAGLWTRDMAKAHQISAKLDAGTVWVNCYNVLDPSMPFGGFKESGWGREHGHEVLNHYTEVKSVCMAFSSV
jgi:phenylacetaldehyde dehydrogenase